MQTYSNPERESDATASPDVEVFHVNVNGESLEVGYYWWSCFPGCLPDGEPNGPFETEEAAKADARNAHDNEHDAKGHHERQSYHARLIAAAPELLQSCVGFEQLSNELAVALTPEHISEVINKITTCALEARAAIARVQGGAK